MGKTKPYFAAEWAIVPTSTSRLPSDRHLSHLVPFQPPHRWHIASPLYQWRCRCGSAVKDKLRRGARMRVRETQANRGAPFEPGAKTAAAPTRPGFPTYQVTEKIQKYIKSSAFHVKPPPAGLRDGFMGYSGGLRARPRFWRYTSTTWG